MLNKIIKRCFFRFIILIFVAISISNCSSIIDCRRVNNISVIKKIDSILTEIAKKINTTIDISYRNPPVLIVNDYKFSDLDENYSYVKVVSDFEVGSRISCEVMIDFKFEKTKIDKILDFCISESSDDINFEPINYDYILGSYYSSKFSNFSNVYKPECVVRQELIKFGEIKDDDRLVIALPNVEKNNNLNEWILIQRGIRNGDLFEKRFTISSDFDFDKSTDFHEIKEENKSKKGENSFFSWFFSFKKNNLNVSKNEEEKYLLSN